jgi:tetratricopeptide (TPR) repeat protein
MPATIIRLSLAMIVVIFAVASALGQQIRGQVRYAESNQPATNTTIRCEGIGGSSIQMTDASGKFFFAVSPGHYTVTVHIPGYQEEQQSADLTDTNSNEYFFFKLKADGPPRATSGSVVDINAVPPKAREEFDKATAAIAEAKKETIQDGVAHLQKAISLFPNYIDAYFMLGATYMDLHEWDKAEQSLKRVLEINPNAVNAMFALGEIYLSKKKDDEAVTILLQGLKVQDGSSQGHLTLGRVYWDQGSKIKDEAQWRPLLEKAYAEAKRALELNPNLAGAHLLKGDLLFRVRRFEDAVMEFEEYLRLDPQGQFAEPTRAMVDKIKKALADAPKQKP